MRVASCAALCLAWMAVACQPAQEPSPLPPPPRESAIPADAVKVTPQQDAHPPVLHSSAFSPPEPVHGISSAGAEDSAFVTKDGSALYFFFTPDVRVPPEKQLVDGVTGIYVSEQEGEGWGEAERVMLQDSREVALDGCVCVQGEEMWFCSARQGNHRGVDMWTATQRDGRWQDWENAGELLNAGYQIGEVHLSSDGTALYFHSDRQGGKGGYDIWVTTRSTGGWSAPVNIEAVNSPETEGWPFVTTDGGEMWFTRWYMGTPAVFRSVLGPQGWTEPVLVISQFAGEPSLDDAGNLYFTHHFYRDGVMLEADIYVARRVS
ncbi:MAG: hypothetical protein M0R22_02815 [Dehalococcoidia bacterium]|nr:hypothetical protein [Dehalococcoidia bacterium]